MSREKPRKTREGERDGPAAWFEARRRSLARFNAEISRTDLPLLFAVFFGAVLIAAFFVWLVERGSGHGMFRSFFDGIWWALVTIATVGYGDTVPVTLWGRIFAMVLIIVGIIVTALISGTVASIFVERRIREGKGLQELKLKNHLLVCGWNPNSEAILRDLESSPETKNQSVVLVNLIEAEGFDSLKAHFPELDIRFVRGDFTQETVLKRASAKTARVCIFVPDDSGGNSTSNADERTILGCLAVRSLNPDIEVSAEILRPESEQHLRRAKVENVVVNGEFSGFLLSASSVSRAIPRAARRLLSAGGGPRLRELVMPPALIGKTFAEAAAWFIANGKGILIGVYSEERGVSLDDLLSDDTSAIDAFIKRKFQEAEIDLAAAASAGTNIRLAPPADYLIRENDAAFIVG
jgi:voltage-gated potassium channel